MVAAETINGMPGIGGMVRDAQRFNQSDVVILGIIIIGAIGFAIEMVMRRLESWLVPWRGKGSTVSIETDGADEAEAMEALVALIADYFGGGE